MGKDQSLKLPHPLILASTSKYRANLLSQLGWPFTAVPPGVDEGKVKEKNFSPRELTLELSRMKARAVFVKYNDSCVIGSDQVCSIDGTILDKPGTVQKAREQLSFMQNKAHKLMTAVTILAPGKEHTFFNETTLHMRALTLKDIIQYVEEDSPLDCAGSYKLESKGIKLFKKIEMDDHTSIIGLPLVQLTNHLLELGYPL